MCIQSNYTRRIERRGIWWRWTNSADKCHRGVCLWSYSLSLTSVRHMPVIFGFLRSVAQLSSIQMRYSNRPNQSVNAWATGSEPAAAAAVVKGGSQERASRRQLNYSACSHSRGDTSCHWRARWCQYSHSGSRKLRACWTGLKVGLLVVCFSVHWRVTATTSLSYKVWDSSAFSETWVDILKSVKYLYFSRLYDPYN